MNFPHTIVGMSRRHFTAGFSKSVRTLRGTQSKGGVT